MVLVRLHQLELGGKGSYPLSLTEFDGAHAEAFIRGHERRRSTSERSTPKRPLP